MLDVTAYPVVDAPQRDHPCGSRWAVAQTHPQAERWAAANLERQGYQTYLPLIAVRRRDRATPTIWRSVNEPLFRSYLFVIPGSHWAPIPHTRGVARLLMADNHPALIQDHAIAAIQSALQAAKALAATQPHWAPGTPCSLAQGPMRGLPAVVTHCRDDSATIACLFLGQLREITVPVDCLIQRDNA